MRFCARLSLHSLSARLASAQLGGSSGLTRTLGLLAVINMELEFTKPGCIISKISFVQVLLRTASLFADSAQVVWYTLLGIAIVGVTFVLCALLRALSVGWACASRWSINRGRASVV